MPVSYPPTTMRCQTICHGRSDMPTTSTIEAPTGQERTVCTGRTDEWPNVLRKKAACHPPIALSPPSSVLGESIRAVGPHCWVPWGLSILSP
jgi:hypothetical protein